MKRGICSICGDESDEISFLGLYVVGSEGVNACLDCRITLTEAVRGMMRACIRARRDGYLSAKRVAQAKAERTGTV